MPMFASRGAYVGKPLHIGNLAIVLPEFGKVGVVARFREGADTLDGCVKRLPVDQVEDCGADCIVGRFGIENDDRRDREKRNTDQQPDDPHRV